MLHVDRLRLRTDEVAALLVEWYKLQLLSGLHPPSVRLMHPPHSLPHALVEEWRESGMSDDVISIISKLPYLSGDERCELAPDTKHLNYLEDGYALSVWKDPFGLSTRKHTIEGYMQDTVVLTDCGGQGGWFLVLKIATNTIYQVCNNLGETDNEKPEHTPSWYYLHYPHGPANTILQDWIQKTRQLEWVPDFENDMWMTEDEDWEHTGKFETTKRLYLEHGWPDHFRKEEVLQKMLIGDRK